MIGPGTGIAPFRAFVRERALASPACAETVLLFGGRNRAGDFLYEAEWRALESAGRLTLLTAFSRDPPARVYVQDVLVRERARLQSLLDRGGVVFLCGSVVPTASYRAISRHDVA